MLEDKVHAALHLLSYQALTGILSLDQEFEVTSVHYILKDKHPPAQFAHPSALLPPSACPTEYHPVMFETVKGDLIQYLLPSKFMAQTVHWVWILQGGAACVQHSPNSEAPLALAHSSWQWVPKRSVRDGPFFLPAASSGSLRCER